MPDPVIVPTPSIDVLTNPSGSPALSSTSDMPVVETKPDAQNEGAPPAAPEPEAEVVEAEGEGETEGESATPPDSPSASDKAPKAKGVQKRLDELVKQREDAERRVSEEREEKLRLLAIVEGRDKPAPQTVEVDADPEPAKPRPEDFADTSGFERALLSYVDDKFAWAGRKAAKEQEQVAIAEGIRKSQESFHARRQKAMDRYADFKEVADSPTILVPQIAVQAIIHHELGPDLQYYLGKNPQEAQRLSAIDNPLLQAMELGSMLAKLNTPPPASAKPTVSNAPPPIKPITANGSAPAKSLYDIAETGSMEEYAAARKAQLTRGVRH